MRPHSNRARLAVAALAGAMALAACGGAVTAPPKSAETTRATAAAQSPTPPVVEKVVPKDIGAPTEAPKPSAPAAALPEPTQPVASRPSATVAPAVQPTATRPAPPVATAQPAPAVLEIEPRLVELEWAPVVRLGDSDGVRLSLVPDAQGFLIGAETGGKVVTRSVPVPRPAGYDVVAIAVLSGVAFDVSPGGDQTRDVPEGQPVVWRWTVQPRGTGEHRLALSLTLRQTPRDRAQGAPREFTAFSRSLDMRVVDVFGLPAPLAGVLGVIGLAVGGGLSAAAMLRRPGGSRRALAGGTTVTIAAPNAALALETHPAVQLAPQDGALLRAMFRDYARVVVESEFRSGYSGARTYLARPIRRDGRAEAATIAKIGDARAIRREHENFERHVKNTLPAMTARIQEPPVQLPPTQRGAPASRSSPEDAILRYTFVGAPGVAPVSLRQALLQTGDPALLHKLFDTFGPNWWMQRKPWQFRMAVEYDRVLPAHVVVAPLDGGGRDAVAIRGDAAPAMLRVAVGDTVALRGFANVERRADGRSLSLGGAPSPGQPPVRVRWMDTAFRDGALGRVIATRETLLRDAVSGVDLGGLPDPLDALTALLNESVNGTESIIHGDLNLENALVAGGLVWLIDFAGARLGHPLFDFAHLHADVIAHVVARGGLSALAPADEPLLRAMHDIAARCLYDPARPREYHLALAVACMGALKYENLDASQKRALYLAAARTVRDLGQT